MPSLNYQQPRVPSQQQRPFPADVSKQFFSREAGQSKTFTDPVGVDNTTGAAQRINTPEMLPQNKPIVENDASLAAFSGQQAQMNPLESLGPLSAEEELQVYNAKKMAEMQKKQLEAQTEMKLAQAKAMQKGETALLDMLQQAEDVAKGDKRALEQYAGLFSSDNRLSYAKAQAGARSAIPEIRAALEAKSEQRRQMAQFAVGANLDDAAIGMAGADEFLAKKIAADREVMAAAQTEAARGITPNQQVQIFRDQLAGMKAEISSPMKQVSAMRDRANRLLGIPGQEKMAEQINQQAEQIFQTQIAPVQARMAPIEQALTQAGIKGVPDFSGLDPNAQGQGGEAGAEGGAPPQGGQAGDVGTDGSTSFGQVIQFVRSQPEFSGADQRVVIQQALDLAKRQGIQIPPEALKRLERIMGESASGDKPKSRETIAGNVSAGFGRARQRSDEFLRK